LNQSEVFMLIQSGTINIAIDATMKHIHAKLEVSFRFTQAQINSTRRFLAQIGIAQLIGIGRQVHAMGIEFLRCRHALRTG